MRSTTVPIATEPRGSRTSHKSASLIEMTAVNCSAAAVAYCPTADAATPGFSARVRTTSTFTDTPFSAPFTSCAASPPIRASTPSQSSSITAGSAFFTRLARAAADFDATGPPMSPRRSVAQVRIVRRRGDSDSLTGIHTMNLRRLHVPGDGIGGVPDGQLIEQERELLVVRLRERSLGRRGKVPQLTLERTKRLLARLVEKLLVRVGRLPLVFRVLQQPCVDRRPQLRRHVVEQHVLEVRREMNLGGFALWKIVKRDRKSTRLNSSHL